MNGCWLPSKMMETAYLNCSKKENVNSDLFMQQKHLKEWKYYIAKQWKTDRILCNSVGHCTAFVNVKEAFKPKEMKTDGRWNLLEGVKSTINKIMKKRKFLSKIKKVLISNRKRDHFYSQHFMWSGGYVCTYMYAYILWF